jgi:hypothetical protein
LPAQQLQGKVEFLLEFQGEKIVPGQQYFSEKLKDSILIETLRFYVSDLQFFAEGKPITEASKMPFLIDSDVPESHSTTLILSNDKQFDEVRFTLGLDSLINVSGALGGDLDPTKGMYWAWQSGYINFKLEGETEACPARNHAFQYHLGGYRPPFQTVQSISVKGKSTRDFRIVVDIAAFLEQMDVSQDYQVMSPNAKAVELSAMLPAMFHAAK